MLEQIINAEGTLLHSVLHTSICNPGTFLCTELYLNQTLIHKGSMTVVQQI